MTVRTSSDKEASIVALVVTCLPNFNTNNKSHIVAKAAFVFNSSATLTAPAAAPTLATIPSLDFSHGHAAYHLVVNLSDDHIDGHAHDHQVVDLPDEKLQALHKEAKALYDSYIKVSQFQKHYFYPD